MPHSHSETTETDTDTVTKPAIDLAAMEEMFGSITKRSVASLGSFVSSSRELMATLGVELDAQNWPAAHKLSHSLKGAARTAGALVLGDLFQTQEKALKSGDTLTACAVHPAIKKEFERVCAHIDHLFVEYAVTDDDLQRRGQRSRKS